MSYWFVEFVVRDNHVGEAGNMSTWRVF